MTTPPPVRYLGLISDTHGHQEFTGQALRVLESFAPVAIVHAGDVGGPEIVRLFPSAPTCHFVQGNCDYAAEELGQAVTKAGHTWWGRFGDFQVENRRIALLHGDDARRLNDAMTSGAFDLVIHGHTHIARHELIGTTHVVNPGAVYRANPPSVAVVDLATLAAEVLTFR